MILFSERISPRLTYIAEFISGECLNEALLITTDTRTYQNYQGPRLNYSARAIADKEIRIHPHGLLFEKGVQAQVITMQEWESMPVFFATPGPIPFDLLSACFFLISRYEEYLPHDKDEYGRYAHQNSLAFQNGFLHRPLVNEWIEEFKKKVNQVFPDFSFRSRQFQLLPTYDIDIAYSYRGKGWWRNGAGYLRSLFTGRLSAIKERWMVLKGKQQDPYDAYDWIDEVHGAAGFPALYFFHAGKRRVGYDKSIPPSHPLMQSLIRRMAGRYPVGVHPTWQSGDREELLAEEIQVLQTLTEKPVTISRFHYIRFHLPHSYHRLIDAGIREDHSMGYGSINGFRASVSSAFYWYDLEKEERTPLLIYPFCFMDANSFFEQKWTAGQAKEECLGYIKRVRDVNGMMVMIWHNNFLGTDPTFINWREAYAKILHEASGGHFNL